MNLRKFDVELSLTNKEECEQSALTILKELRPEWETQKIKFEYFSVGITNKIFSVGIESEQVIFRVFGKNTDKIIDRNNEIVAWKKLADYNLAAPLYGQFKNGLICGFMNGKSLTIDQMRQPEFYRKVAGAFANLHKIVPADDKPILFEKMHKFNSAFVRNYEDIAKQEFFTLRFPSKFEDDIQKLESAISKDEEVAFCHNDALVHNIVYNPEDGNMGFIDYEYASSNYVLFDIANHFCESAGVDDTPDYSLCYTKQQKLEFLQEYLGEEAQTEKGKKRIDEMMLKMPLFEAAAHLFWAIWALVQSQNSTIDFDYLAYSAARYDQYNKRFDKFIESRQNECSCLHRKTDN